MFLNHEVTKRHGFLQVYFNIILINVAIKSSLDADNVRVKVGNDLGGIGISYEEAICTWRDKERVYGRSSGAIIYFVAWFQWIFPFLGFIVYILHPLYDKF